MNNIEILQKMRQEYINMGLSTENIDKDIQKYNKNNDIGFGELPDYDVFRTSMGTVNPSKVTGSMLVGVAPVVILGGGLLLIVSGIVGGVGKIVEYFGED